MLIGLVVSQIKQWERKLLLVEQAFVGRECNLISPKNDCMGGYHDYGLEDLGMGQMRSRCDCGHIDD